jgi:uncharacterized BrkB/YihY/UPF0761 family membrane protein
MMWRTADAGVVRLGVVAGPGAIRTVASVQAIGRSRSNVRGHHHHRHHHVVILLLLILIILLLLVLLVIIIIIIIMTVMATIFIQRLIPP